VSAAFKCDRCCEFESGGQANVITTTGPKLGRRVELNAIELCSHCAQQLKNWLESPVAKAAP